MAVLTGVSPVLLVADFQRWLAAAHAVADRVLGKEHRRDRPE
jgi:hypothetical protein